MGSLMIILVSKVDPIVVFNLLPDSLPLEEVAKAVLCEQ